MSDQSFLPRAFTAQADGILNVLKTEFHVSQASDISGTNQEMVKALGIWDTGATNTAISQKLASQLSLKPISQARVDGVHGHETVNVYMVDIVLPNRVLIGSVKVSEAKNLLDCDLLIGMDLICLGDFAVTNHENKTTLTFRIPPNNKHIDFVEEISRNNENQKSFANKYTGGQGGSKRKSSRRK
jgi:hypothetical protein